MAAARQARLSPSLLRTHSTSSVESVETNASSTGKTRKRFTGYQLMILENLHTMNSHPTREEREAAAGEGNMDLKSVTIWFQNKRQAEKRTVLRNTTNNGCLSTTDRSTGHAPTRCLSLSSMSPASSTPSTPSTEASSDLRRSRTLSFNSKGATVLMKAVSSLSSSKNSSSKSRPSLDQIASQKERSAPIPISPQSNSTIWDNMPESPARSPASPGSITRSQRTLLRHSRTLEWACEAARHRGKRLFSESEDESEDMNMEHVYSRLKKNKQDDILSMAAILAKADHHPVKRARTTDDLRSPFRTSQPAFNDRSIKSEVFSSRETDTSSSPLSRHAQSSADSLSYSQFPSSSSMLVYPSTDARTTLKADQFTLTMGHTPTVATPKSKSSRATQSAVCSTRVFEDANADDEMMQAAWALCGLGAHKRSLVAC